MAITNAQWEAMKQRREELGLTVADHTLDPKKRQVYQRELSHLTSVLSCHETLDRVDRALADVSAQAAENTDEQMAELYQQELADLRTQKAAGERELDEVLAPTDEHDDRSVYLEIRAGTGGKEAALFAADLLKMYTNYALKKGWKATVEELSETDLGGYKEVVLHIKGNNVYGHLKRESGVHRVQRVPATESAGRVHTSTATIAVLPEADDVDVTINPADLRIDVFRASGAGGQHVNTTDSAVRITHLPTGVVVSCQDERSQHKNKTKALKILQSRLLATLMEQKEAQMSEQRREQVGGGKRSEKVRTYNYPQNRVTDHQVELTLQKLDIVMTGEIDEIIEALRAQEREHKRAQFLQRF